jgi:peptide/nickel transport system permease protein
MSLFFKSELFYRFSRSCSALTGFTIIIAFLVLVLAGPRFAPQNPYDLRSLDLEDAYKPPMWLRGGEARFPLGTDEQGRDILSGIVYGSRISLAMGLGTMLCSCLIGTIVGLGA